MSHYELRRASNGAQSIWKDGQELNDADILAELTRLATDNAHWRALCDDAARALANAGRDVDTLTRGLDTCNAAWLAATGERDALRAKNKSIWSACTAQEDEITRLRSALAGLIGAESEEELRTMEALIRLTAAPAADKTAMMDAIHALLTPPIQPPRDEHERGAEQKIGDEDFPAGRGHG